jgi:hypothetical protein
MAPEPKIESSPPVVQDLPEGAASGVRGAWKPGSVKVLLTKRSANKSYRQHGRTEAILET